MSNQTLDYAREQRLSRPTSVWDQGERTPVVPRGPWRTPAVIAVCLAWLTSPPVLGAIVLAGHHAMADRPSQIGAGLMYLFALPSTLIGFIATAIAYPLNTSPHARSERSMCRQAMFVNVFTLLGNLALLALALIAMSVGQG